MSTGDLLRTLTERVEEFCRVHHLIEEGDDVLLCFSLGKDSLALLRILRELRSRLRFEFSAVLVVYPKHRFTEEVPEYLTVEGTEVHVVIPEEGDEVLEQGFACRYCKEVRRRYLRDFVYRYRYRKVATAHTLWDLIAYTLELLLTTNFLTRDPLTDERCVEVLSRFLPRYCAGDGVEVIHPLLTVTEEETEYLAQLLKVPRLRPCRYRSQRPKRVLSTYLHTMSQYVRPELYYTLHRFLNQFLDWQRLVEYLRQRPFDEYLL